MKERPIIMSGNHPKLILDGIKIMTRRVIKPQPFKGCWNATAEHPSYGWSWKKLYQTWEGEEDFFKRLVEHCPYGQVGDRLWVREICMTDSRGNLHYKASEPNWVAETRNKTAIRIAWKPSIHMFKKDARIWLEITGVRVERVQDITEKDAIAEGVGYKTTNEHAYLRVLSQGKANKDNWPTPQEAFQTLWDSLNAKRGYGWMANPWVWVISFKRIKTS